MKTLLVPVEPHDSIQSVLTTALLVAAKFGAHIEGYALRPAIGNMVTMDPVNSLTVVSLRENDLEIVKEARGIFETFMRTVEGATVPGPTGEQMAGNLLRHGVRAESIIVAPGQRRPGEVLLAQAESLGCDLVVKGAYTQSRLRQMIFGGTTQHILSQAGVPVLLAH